VRAADRPLADRSLDDEGHLAVDAPENPQVCRKGRSRIEDLTD
jgi:hypothetical protein